MVNLIGLYNRFVDKVDFLTVYGLESHSQPSGFVDLNRASEDGGVFRDPKTIEERIAVVREFVQSSNYPIPVFLDTMSNATSKECFALPERMFVIERGFVVYKGKKGPPYFLPGDVENWLEERFDD